MTWLRLNDLAKPADAVSEPVSADAPTAQDPMAEAPNAASTVSGPVLESNVIEAIRKVYDPEIPINIHELGLIYGIEIEPPGVVKIKMTLTAPTCPEAGAIPGRVEAAVNEVPGVSGVVVDLVWDPPWNPEKMSDAAKLQLGIL
jgi:FeS assembly SUF system protein